MIKYRIFVSGVQKELGPERRAVKNFIKSDALLSEYFDVFLFEDAPAKSKSAQKSYIETESNLARMGLNERQLQAVKYVREKGQISNQVYQEINKVIKRTASRDLARLVSLGVFQKVGITGKGTLYVLRGHKGDKGDIKGT